MWYHEKNEDLPPKERFHWLVIAARGETLEAYQALRKAGHSPARSLAPFAALLSYSEAEGVHTGCDACREAFGND